jgi:hypothetical protein
VILEIPPHRVFSTGGHGVSRFSRREFLRMPGVFDSAGPGAVARCRPHPCCLPPALTASAPQIAGFRSSITCLRFPLSHPSSAASRPPSQGWGPGWLATPSLYDSFIRDCMLVYPGAIQGKPRPYATRGCGSAALCLAVRQRHFVGSSAFRFCLTFVG